MSAAAIVALTLSLQPAPPRAGLFAWWQAGIDRLHEAWIERLHGRPVAIPLAGDSLDRVVWRGEIVALAVEAGRLDPLEADRLTRRLDAFWLACRRIADLSPPADPVVLRRVGRGPLVVVAPHRAPPHALPADPVVVLDEALFAELRAAADAPLALGPRLPLVLARPFFLFEAELGPLADPGGFDDLVDAFAALLAANASESLGWRPPPDPIRSEASTDVDWLSLVAESAHASGRSDVVRRLWRALSECPPANDRAEARANLAVALSAASGRDESDRLAARGIAIDDATRRRITEALAAERLRPR